MDTSQAPLREPEPTGIRVDVIVPVRNEAENIPPFLASIDALPLPPEVALSVIFVEDGSTDDTVDRLRAVSRDHPGVRFYSLEKGFGEGPAIVFGLSRSEADAMVMMAVESHPPELIPPMIQAFQRGAEVVQCVRGSFTGREQQRDVMTALFPSIIRLLTGFDHEVQNVYYRLVSRDFSRWVLASPRFWRFVRFPLPDPESGALVVLQADMAEREHGESEYGVLRLFSLGGDAILAWMSGTRFLALALGGVALLGVLVAVDLAAVAIPPALLVAAIAARYLWIRNVNVLDRMVVRKSTDHP